MSPSARAAPPTAPPSNPESGPPPATPAAVFRALADPHRLRALHFLARAQPSCCASGEGVCACDLVAHLGLAQPTVSHHLRVLVDAGLVDARKYGRWTHYTLRPAGLEPLRHTLAALDQGGEEMDDGRWEMADR